MSRRTKGAELTYGSGPDAARRFEDGLNRILQVSKKELERREAAHQESVKDAPRRGPKPSKK